MNQPKYFKLSNGMEGYYQQEPDAWFYVQLIGTPGAINDDGKWGTAHFLEHYVHLGCEMFKTKSEFEKFVKLRGGRSNAATSKLYVFYWIQGLADYSKELLEAAVSVVFKPTFPENEFEREKGVVLQESRIGESNAEKVHDINENKFIFSKDEEFTRVIGSSEDINGISLDDLKSFHNKYYSPQNFKIQMIAPFSFEEAIVLLESLTKDLKSKEMLQKSRFNFNTSTKYFETISTEATDAKISLYFPPYSALDSIKFYPARIGNRVFGDGSFSSRLMKKLRLDLGLVYSVSSYLTDTDDGYESGITFRCKTSDVELAYKSIISELNNLQEKGISKEEFDIIKNATLLEEKINSKNVGDELSFLLGQLRYNINKFKSKKYFFEYYRSITLEEVNEAIKDCFIQTPFVSIYTPTSVIDQIDLERWNS